MLYHPCIMSAFHRMCLARGLAVVVVGFPATPLLALRARFCISAAHDPKDLQQAVQVGVWIDVCEWGEWGRLRVGSGQNKLIGGRHRRWSGMAVIWSSVRCDVVRAASAVEEQSGLARPTKSTAICMGTRSYWFHILACIGFGMGRNAWPCSRSWHVSA